MTAQLTRLRCCSRIAMPAWLCALLLWIPGMLPVANACDVEGETAEQVISQIWLGEWRDDLPAGVSLVVTGGGLISPSFPALSSDGAQIALLYYAGHPMHQGYPTFEIHSTSTLSLLERIELVPGTDGDRADLRDTDVLAELERDLVPINGRLREDTFRPMETLFKRERYERLEGAGKFGKRIDYPSSSTRRALTITSLPTGKVELDLEMQSGKEIYMTEPEVLGCGWGGNPEQGWYAPELGIAVLRITFSTSTHGCEQPEQWLIKRLGSP